LVAMNARIKELEKSLKYYRSMKLVADKLRPAEIARLVDYCVFPVGHLAPGHVNKPPEYPSEVYKFIKEKGKKIGLFTEAGFGQYTTRADVIKYSKQVFFLTAYKGPFSKFVFCPDINILSAPRWSYARSNR